MSKVDFFGHAFYFFLFLGMLLLQAKDYRGWAFRFAGELGWIGIGFYLGMSSIWAWGFAFMAVDVLGYFKWQKEQEELASLEWAYAATDLTPLILEEEDPGYEYVKLQAEVKKNGKNKTVKRKSKRARVAKRNSKTTNRKVRSARRRSSK